MRKIIMFLLRNGRYTKIQNYNKIRAKIAFKDLRYEIKWNIICYNYKAEHLLLDTSIPNDFFSN